mgnify:CR=1 FL=1
MRALRAAAWRASGSVGMREPLCVFGCGYVSGCVGGCDLRHGDASDLYARRLWICGRRMCPSGDAMAAAHSGRV